MTKFTRRQFEKLAQVGSIRQATNKDALGEDLCETALEFGIANGYALADICRFYAHAQGYKNDVLRQGRTDRQALDEAFTRFLHHAVHFAGTLIDAAPKIKQQATVKRSATKKALKPQTRK